MYGVDEPMINEETFIRGIRRRVRNNWDIVICITGEEGCGKSTLAQILGFKLDKHFDQIKNIVYIPTPDNIKKTFNLLPPYSVFLIDEATEVFYKMDFMKDFQKTLVKMYKRERKQNKITILCLPSFIDLTKPMRNDRVKIWIHIFKRGLAGIFVKHPSLNNEDPWMLKDYVASFAKKFSRRKSIDISPEDILDHASKMPIFWDEIKFLELSEEKQKIYEEQGRIQRDKFYAEEENKEITSVSAMRKHISKKLNKIGWTQKEIAELLGVERSSVTRYVSEKKDFVNL